MSRAQDPRTKAQLLEENEQLRARLEEAEQTLQAIRSGDVDALVVEETLERRVRERTAELAQANAGLRSEIQKRKQAEETVKGERQRFDDILEILPAYLVLLSPDYHVPFANRFFRERFGESHGRRCFEYLFGRSEPCETCESYKPLQTKAPHRWEWTGPDGRNYDIYDFPFADSDGSPLIMEMGIDITERKRAEEAVRQANAYNRSLIEATLDPLVTIDADGKITDVNAATEKATGVARQDLIGTDFSDYFTAPEKARQGYQQVFRQGAVQDYPLEIRHKDGWRTPVLYNAAVYHDEVGNVVGVFAAARDVTERRRAEEALQRAHDLLEVRVQERTTELAQANAQLRETRDYLDNLLTYANAPIIVWDPDFRITRFNTAFERLTGLEAGDVCGESLDILFPEERKEEALAHIHRTLAGERWEVVEIPIRHVDGTVRTVLWNSATLYAADGATVVATIAQGQDITERKQAEEALQSERNILQTIMENTRAHLAYLDSAFNFVAANSTYAQGSGYSASELIGRNHFVLFPHAENQAIFERVRDTGEPVEFRARPFEFPERPELGTTYWDWTLAPVKGADGQTEGLVLSLVDVTQQMRAQAEIESLARFPRENPHPVLRLTRDGTILYANLGSAPLLARWGAQVGQKAPDEWERLVAGVLDAGAEQVVEAPSDGRTFSVTIAPFMEKGYANLYGLDITDLKVAQQGLRRYADLLRLLHEADQAILAARSEEEIAEVAIQHVSQLLNCVRASVMLFDRKAGEVSLLAVHAQGKTRLEKGWRGPLYAEWPGMLEALVRGETYVVEDMQEEASSSPVIKALQSEGVRAYIQVPLAVLGQLVGSLALGMETPGPLTSEQIEIVLELAIEIAIGIQQARLHDQVRRHADELEEEVLKRTQALRASEARFRAIFEEAGIGIALVDGEGRIEESNPALQEIVGYGAEELRGMLFATFSHADEAQSTVELFKGLLAENAVDRHKMERRYVRKDGQLRWGNVTASVVRESEAPFAVVMVEDTTEQKRAHEALLRSEKLAVTGRLAASLAHEINNPLQSVIGCLELAEESLAAGQAPGRFLQLAAEELERAAGIVAQLRDLNRPSKPEDKAPTDVNALVGHVLALTRKQCQKRQVEVVWETAEGLPSLMLVLDRIEQVLLNLVLNAAEAMPHGGRLEVRTSRTPLPAGVCISVTDSGQGVAADVLPHLFDPFCTTKPDGLGLGLYISRRIVEEHRGHIEVESRAGEGATFMVWLPE